MCSYKKPSADDGLGICDNCFACEEHGGVMTIPNPGVKFMSCNVCRTALYCSPVSIPNFSTLVVTLTPRPRKTCQRDAWNHHHKFECGFRKVFARAPSLQARISGLTQRLASMRANNKVSSEEWTEIRCLFRGRITQDLGDQLAEIESSMNNKAAMFASFVRDTGKQRPYGS